MGRAEGSVLKGTLLSLAVGAVLFWVPLVGPLVAGFAGGRLAGTTEDGLLVGLLPALEVGLLAGVVLPRLPLLGPLLGGFFEGGPWVIVQMGLVLAGGLLGGAVEEREFVAEASAP